MGVTSSVQSTPARQARLSRSAAEPTMNDSDPPSSCRRTPRETRASSPLRTRRCGPATFGPLGQVAAGATYPRSLPCRTLWMLEGGSTSSEWPVLVPMPGRTSPIIATRAAASRKAMPRPKAAPYTIAYEVCPPRPAGRVA